MRLKIDRTIAVAGLALALTASSAVGAVYGTETAGSFLTEEEAEQLALTDAGALREEAEGVRTKAEWEDGASVYEVEFYLDRVEYDYIISQETGQILQWSVEGKDAGSAQVELTIAKADSDAGGAENKEGQQTEAALKGEETNGISGEEEGQTRTDQTPAEETFVIGIAKAKEIVLADAGLTEEEVSFQSLSFDRSRGYADYELEFCQDRREYEYTVDAKTGEIVSFEQD